MIIALDAEDILERFGAAVVTASTPDAAHDLLDGGTVNLAILDINLGDQTSFGIADRLSELDIPFFFASGYGEQANLPMEHRRKTVVQKPYTTHNLAKAIYWASNTIGCSAPTHTVCRVVFTTPRKLRRVHFDSHYDHLCPSGVMTVKILAPEGRVGDGCGPR